jgi:hypothetical protein
MEGIRELLTEFLSKNLAIGLSKGFSLWKKTHSLFWESMKRVEAP